MAGLRGGGAPLEERMRGYPGGTYSPSFARPERVALVARVGGEFAGYGAGQLTTRFGCDGELQWLNVAEGFRGQGVADALIQSLAKWFVQSGATRVCVNVDPENVVARRVYERHGAQALNEHFLVWPDIRVAVV